MNEASEKDDTTLAERRLARRSDLSEVGELTTEVGDLAIEVHKLRGTLNAYAPRTEMSRHFDERIEAVRKTLAAARRRQTMMWVTSILVIITVLTAAMLSVAAVNREALNRLQEEHDVLQQEIFRLDNQ